MENVLAGPLVARDSVITDEDEIFLACKEVASYLLLP